MFILLGNVKCLSIPQDLFKLTAVINNVQEKWMHQRYNVYVFGCTYVV